MPFSLAFVIWTMQSSPWGPNPRCLRCSKCWHGMGFIFSLWEALRCWLFVALHSLLRATKLDKPEYPSLVKVFKERSLQEKLWLCCMIARATQGQNEALWNLLVDLCLSVFICLSVYLIAYLSGCLSLYFIFCLSDYLSVCLTICLSFQGYLS